MPKCNEEKRVYCIRISMEHHNPEIWRRVHLLSSTTLGQLHSIIQKTMGWTDRHAHEFETDVLRCRVRDLKSVTESMALQNMVRDRFLDDDKRLEQVASPGITICYTYFFDTGWSVLIKTEKEVEYKARARLPKCAGGRRASLKEVKEWKEKLKAGPSNPVVSARLDRRAINTALQELQATRGRSRG
ncbi:plasmid pRiA4b ORF-3-like protein-domain-containing protein [Mortierella sp. GBAus27b]|nr:hypothetical protein BGX31_008065 [Mortierella sp. GBA43]KAI8353112.1 plasmid pRiA4b ORF-3-like protein-domain-containing protein [Mortierella sp. GBAus27b]